MKTTRRPAFAKASAVAVRAMADKSVGRQNLIAAAPDYMAVKKSDIIFVEEGAI